MKILRLSENTLKQIISEATKKVLREYEVNTKTKKYHTALVMYTLRNGVLRENERTKDHMDHLIRRYNNIRKKYEKAGCKTFKISYLGRKFLVIVDRPKGMISFVTILQDGDYNPRVLGDEQLTDIGELLEYYGMNPAEFGIVPEWGAPRSNVRLRHRRKPTFGPGSPDNPAQEREMRGPKIFTNWDMMDRTPKKWRKVRDEWQFNG